MIELLVVVVVLGVLVSALVLSIGGSSDRALELQARRLQGLLQLACEQAELTGRDVGVFMSADGVGFAWRGPDRWYPLTEAAREPLRTRALEPGIEMTLERDDETLRLPSERPEAPQLVCLSSGELTPFLLRFARADVTRRWLLRGAMDARLDVEAEDAR
ncbi:MAG: GspH/FimT family pseudopilin [Aquimonas sp.]|nr:GspH/FimT family pseudopilin [Aquimonas sp.]